MQKTTQGFKDEDKHIAKHGQGFSKLLQNNTWKGYSQTGVSLQGGGVLHTSGSLHKLTVSTARDNSPSQFVMKTEEDI